MCLGGVESVQANEWILFRRNRGARLEPEYGAKQHLELGFVPSGVYDALEL